MKYNFILLLFLLLFGVDSHAQETRIEIKLDKMPLNAEIVSLSKRDFLVLYQTDEGKAYPYNVFNLTKFNRAFDDQWNVLVEIPTRFVLKTTLNDTASNRYIWLSMSSTHLRIDVLNLFNGQHTQHTFVLANRVKEIKSIKIIEDNVFILFNYGPSEQAQTNFSMCCLPIAIPFRMAGLSAFNTGSALVRINLRNKNKVERCDFDKGVYVPFRIQNLKNDSQSIILSSFKVSTRSKVQTKLNIKSLNSELNTMDSMSLTLPNSVYANSVHLSKSIHSTLLIGTYDATPPIQSELSSIYKVQGFYSYVMDSSNAAAPIKLYPLSEIESIKKHDTSNTLQSNPKSKLDQNLSNSFSTQFFIHDGIVSDSEIIFVAEAFMPCSTNRADLYGDNLQTFEGYRNTYFVILCFDKKGHLKWDQTISLHSNTIYQKINPIVNLSLSQRKNQAAYRSKGKLHVFTLEQHSMSHMIDLPNLNPEDEEITEHFAGETSWTDQHMLIHGVQKIKVSKIPEREGSIILYIDQLGLENQNR